MDALMDMQFRFVSETLRELAYEMLTFSVKRTLHRKIGEWFEYTFPDNLDERASELALHWEAASQPIKATKYYFLAAQNYDNIGDFSGILKAAEKARDLLLTYEDETLDGDHKLLLARVAILKFKAAYEVTLTDEKEKMDMYKDLREAIAYLGDGFDYGGGFCQQIVQMCGMLLKHSFLMRDRGVAEAARQANKSPDWISAIRELYYVLRPLQIQLTVAKMTGIPIWSQNLSVLAIGYLRIRLAFFLADDELVGVAFAMHAAILQIAHFPEYARDFFRLAREYEQHVKSDFFHVYLLAAKNVQGLYNNIGVALTTGEESVSLARQLQFKPLLRQQLNFTAHAAYIAGDFRACWKLSTEYYLLSKEDASYTQLGRSAYILIGLLCILDNAERAVTVGDSVLSMNGGVMRRVGYETWLAPVTSLALFRSGREEEANSTFATALDIIPKFDGGPWLMVYIHSLLTEIYEMHTKSVVLRKKTKIERLVQAFVKVLGALKMVAKSTPICEPWLAYWEGMLATILRTRSQASACFGRCISICSSMASITGDYPAVLARLAIARSRQTEGPSSRSDPTQVTDGDSLSHIVEQLAKSGDLYTLSVLNEHGTSGSADAYNGLLEDPVFSDLVSGANNVDDGVSPFAGSPAVHRDSLLMSFGEANANQVNRHFNSRGEQDLLESFFTGRKEELALFDKMAEDFCSTQDAESFVLAVMGPDGIGKSSFLDECARHVDRDRAFVLRGSCRAGESSTAFFPFREVFSTFFGLQRTGSIAEKTKRLTEFVDKNGYYRTIPHRALLKSVLPVNLLDSHATGKMVGRTKAEATVTCLMRFLVARSFSKPIILILDDVQWMDLDSLALLERLLDMPRIGILASARKEGQEEQHYRNFMNNARKLVLKPFNINETKIFLEETFDLENIDQNILFFCHARTEGTPATLLCLVKSLLENHIIVISEHRVLQLSEMVDPSQLDKLETPDSVRELIRAQIAKLNPKALEVLFM